MVPGFEEGDLAPHPIYHAAALGGEVLGSCVKLSCAGAVVLQRWS